MKTFQLLTILAFALVQSNVFSQTEKTETIPTEKNLVVNKQDTKTKNYLDDYKPFLGEYLLVEGDFTLEIVAEDGKLYIVTEFSKDILIPTNKTTLHELTRGVDLELIPDNPNGLKFTQNGYETTIKRVKPKTEN